MACQQSASAGGSPAKGDEQHNQRNDPGGYSAQHGWRGAARALGSLLVGMLSAGLDAF